MENAVWVAILILKYIVQLNKFGPTKADGKIISHTQKKKKKKNDFNIGLITTVESKMPNIFMLIWPVALTHLISQHFRFFRLFYDKCIKINVLHCKHDGIPMHINETKGLHILLYVMYLI